MLVAPYKWGAVCGQPLLRDAAGSFFRGSKIGGIVCVNVDNVNPHGRNQDEPQGDDETHELLAQPTIISS